MSSSEVIERAFAANTNLKKRIFDAIDIAQYHLSSDASNGTSTPSHEEPASKKRKLNGSFPPTTNVGGQHNNQPREVVLEARDVSFSLPQRKKYHLGVAQYGSDIDAPTTTFSIFIRSPATNEVELEIPLSHFAYALRLPVPEKTTKQYNFCLLPTTAPVSSAQPSAEPMIWTVLHGPVKTLTIHSTALSAIASQRAGSDDQIFEEALSFVLSRHSVELTQPSTDEFASATPESHRKKETAYHVRAFRGSKDGFLFFLHNGIFFGFKKPLSFFAFENIESVSYTSVLQRTFNLNIAYREGGSAAEELPDIQEIEFSMLDQADFPGIDAYIKKHGLQDASLAESRRATKVNTASNGKAAVAQAENGDGDDEDGRTELEKAQQLLDDEEDEEEEDYDPSSDEDSGGSGDDSSDQDENDEQYEKERKRATKGRDLIAEELGSEAEDVSVTEDEEDEGEGEGEGREQEQQQQQQEEEEEEEEEEDEEEYWEEEPEQEDVKPVVTSGFASVAMTSPPPQQRQGRWAHQERFVQPDPDDEDQL
ncbi:uncharacterized protein A1O9_08018 [Exophiala aquamarina CBS 119918]|uniref:Histone chaperone RTT106/FACT complex subunit SPT16-like middle domain-containing protein n=1 Tax=Exophiala aquamarina CBS 119918 TaxID=1182545 RepID=A0A072P9K0_9EURO|nr:uncharacterized protein A1O9_08018 [Exophiala aquamarina CBS 119918]KEF56437.1 hypothetical protein A1O9_08018 [Exophiala aquamarina CBS 119918]